MDNEQAYLNTEMNLRDREEVDENDLPDEPTLPGEDDELNND